MLLRPQEDEADGAGADAVAGATQDLYERGAPPAGEPGQGGTPPVLACPGQARAKVQGTKVTKGPGSRAAGLAMAFKLIESAQARRRAVNAPHLVALVRAGASFVNGGLVERPDEEAA